MPKVQDVIFTIVTKEGQGPAVPVVSVNNCRSPLRKISGGVGRGETFVGGAILDNFVHSLCLIGPEAGQWEVVSVEVCATFHSGEEYKQTFGPFVLGNGVVEVSVWQPNTEVREGKDQELAIEAELLTPWTCRFLVNKAVHDGFSTYFGTPEQAQGSPLPEKLFGIAEVTEVIISRFAVTVSVIPGMDWYTLVEPIGNTIRDHLLSGAKAVREGFHKDMPGEEELAKQINSFLETEVNPQIAAHGGFIRLLDVHENNIYLQMGGGCQGCASSQATLKLGVEKAIREIIPQVGEILDQTDHAAGVNPYYPRH